MLDKLKNMKNKTGRSWRAMTTLFLVLIFTVIIAFEIYTNIWYLTSIRRDTQKENTNAVRIWTRAVDDSLVTMNSNLHELLIEIYNNTELRSGSEMMKASIKQDIKTSMTNKLMANPDIDSFCLMDTESSFYLFAAQSALDNQEKQNLKDLSNSYTAENATDFKDTLWDIVQYGGKVYFIRSVRLGKYILSEASSTAHYQFEDIASVSSPEICLLVNKGDSALVLQGGEEANAMISDQGGFRSSSRFITAESSFSYLNGQAVLAVKSQSLFGKSQWMPAVLLILASLVCVLLLILFSRMMYIYVIRPTQTLISANKEMADGKLGYQITEKMDSSEFQELKESFNEMSSRLQQYRDESFERMEKEKENQLHLLRAQIKPHFYLNAITTISNMTYQNRSEDIRTFCVTLSKYMRYMLEQKSGFTTVGEELAHIRNYIELQQIRFPGSVSMEIECAQEAEEVQLPLLVMFTVVENSFKHAMDLYKELKMNIVCRMNQDGSCSVRISDNGPGFAPEVLEDKNDIDEVLKTKNHIGLSNAKYTMTLTFRQTGLLVLSNLPEGGACVDITIPPVPQERSENETSYL